MKRRSWKRTGVVPLAAGLVIAACPAKSSADYYDSNGDFPGSMCRKVGSNGTLKITTDGAIYNDQSSGGTTLTVDCPVASTAQGYTFSNDVLWYLDNSTSSITCTLRAEDNDSSAVDSSTVSSTGDDNIYRSLTFGSVTSFVLGFAHIRCTIPTRDSSGNASYIIGYEARDDGGIFEPIGELGAHTMPGSTCRKVGTEGKVGITAGGTIYNDTEEGGDNLVVDCPVMTTRQGGHTSSSYCDLWFLNASSHTFLCWYATEDASTTETDLHGSSLTLDDDASYHRFEFGNFPLTAFDDGYAHVRCSIPPKDASGHASHVVGYGIKVFR